MQQLSPTELKVFLEEKHDLYNRPDFIPNDPISIPRLFTKKEDIEIAGFLAATIAWGQRATILKNARQLMNGMDDAPHDFILNCTTKDLAVFKTFVHRTFNGEDCIYFIKALQQLYTQHGGLEAAFCNGIQPNDVDLLNAIVHFRLLFFQHQAPGRTAKHVSDPAAGSATKRILMYLRWMVRKDKRGVDFGLWDISPALLSCPLDVHSGRVARSLGLLERKQDDWKAVCELTDNLKRYCPEDPIKYDFSLFGLGVNEGF